MLALAAVDFPPSLYVVLTTSEFVTRADLRRDLCKIRLAVRRRYPAFEYFCAVEWQKRGALHVNLLVRGVPAGRASHFFPLVFRIWSARHRAVPAAQSVQEVRSSRQVAAYVHKLHEYLAKDDQAAPAGWSGHRSSQTRGYLGRPAAEVRPEAVVSLKWKRYRAPLLACGLDGCTAGWRAWEELEPRLLDEWARYQNGPVGQPGLSEIRSNADERERLRELREAEPVSADEQVDVRTVVGGHAVSRAQDHMAPEVRVSPAARIPGEQIAGLPDGRAARVVDQRGSLRNDRVRIERSDIRNDDDVARGNGDRPCLPGMDCEELLGVDSAHWRATCL